MTVQVDLDGAWNRLEELSVVEDPVATISDGKVTLTQKFHDIEVHFKSIGLTDSTRLTVYEADKGDRRNIVLTEVIVKRKKIFLFIYKINSLFNVRLVVNDIFSQPYIHKF